MPVKDQNGAPLAVGDQVRVVCAIASIHEEPNHPELELMTVTPMYAGEYGTRLLLKGAQVERVREAEAPEVPEPAARKKR
jgi:hypothetical protein